MHSYILYYLVKYHDHSIIGLLLCNQLPPLEDDIPDASSSTHFDEPK